MTCVIVIFLAFVWIVLVFFRRLYGDGRPYIDILIPPPGPIGVGPVGPIGVVPPPTYGLAPGSSMVLGSSANIGIFQIKQQFKPKWPHQCMDSQVPDTSPIYWI